MLMPVIMGQANNCTEQKCETEVEFAEEFTTSSQNHI